MARKNINAKRHSKRRKVNSSTDTCFNCGNCVYVGEGGYLCSYNNEIVIEDFMPTDKYHCCRGKRFVRP